MAARRAHDHHQVHVTAENRDTGDVGTPDVVPSPDTKLLEKIGPHPVHGAGALVRGAR